MKKASITTGIIILAACMLAACGSTPAPSITSTSTVIPPTVTEPPSLTPASSRTPLPPPTRRPSQTPTATEINPAYETQRAPFADCNQSFDEKKLSPTKNWYVCGWGGDFQVIYRSNDIRWSFSTQKLFSIEYYGDFSFIHWTADENFLYFAISHPLDGIDPITTNAEALFRMDLSNGRVAAVLGSISTQPLWSHYVISISPTSRLLAYSVNMTSFGEVPSQKKLYLVDLQSGEEKVISIESEYAQIGRYVWSDNGQLLTYKLYTDRSDDVCRYLYSIRLLNLTVDDAITFIKNETIDECTDPTAIGKEFKVLSVSANQVILEKDNERWVYDVASQRLNLQGTVTPSP